jgi:phospholipase/carboxylesterase
MAILEYTFVQSKEEQKDIMICLHGFGSNKDDLSKISFNLPNTSIVYINAPLQLANLESAFAWFSLSFNENKVISFNINEVKETNNLLLETIDEICSKYNVLKNQIILFGFSQGGIMAVYNALHSSNNYKAVICHSGYYLHPELQTQNINKNQNILFIHGYFDNVVSFYLIEQTIELFKDNNIKHEYFFNNSEHNIDAETLFKTENFILNSK